MLYPKIGIRPVIDGRWGGVRESLEAQTMAMAENAAKLISENLKYPDGTPVQCVVGCTTIGGGAEAARVAEQFSTQNVTATLSVTPCWCYGTETFDMDPTTIKAVWGFNGPGGALLAALPVALALAGVSMVLAVLLGWAVALLNRRARHKSLVTVVGTLLFLAVYYAVFQWVGNAVDALALDAVQAGASASRAAAPLRLLGLAAVGNAPALLLLLALAAACMVLCGKALAKPYLRLLTLEPGRVKAEYRAKTQKKQPPRRALLRRELLHLGACPMWLLNCALSSLLLPVLGVAALWKAAALRAFTVAYPPESLPMLVCGMVCTIAAVNFITAPSVSLEGGTLWLLQSLPVTPQQVLRAKVELQLLLTLPAAWLCAGCAMAALRIPARQGLPVLAVLAAFVWLTAQLGLALGLCLPNLHWVSEAAVVKRSAASMLAMFGGWLLAGGVLFLPLILLDYAVPPLAAQTVCLAVLLGLDLLLHRWLRTRGAARFAALH